VKLTIVKQQDNSFKVAYDSDYETLKKFKVGDLLECEIRKPRNYKFHKKFFALLNLVYQNQETYNNIDDLREDLTVASGFYESRNNLQNEPVKKAKSISFAKMSEDDFGKFYNSIVDVIVKYFKFDKETIQENIEQFY
jgi:hypothetical protein